MPITIKSVCDAAKDKLCDEQNFTAAAAVREVQRAIDPNGTKKLNRNQAGAVKAFLEVVIATAYK